jgi:hypothetical protein
MKKGHIIDENNFYVEDYLYNEGDQIPEGIITTEYKGGLYKPKWNGTSWIEGAEQDYIDKIDGVGIEVEETLEEKVRFLEDGNAELLFELAEKEERLSQLESDLTSILLSLGGGDI